jgi:iron complex outermembrane receptor protein
VTNAGAGTVYPAPIQTIDDAYYDASGLRDDTLWGVSLSAPVGSMVTLSATVYGHTNKGQGLWFTPYVPSPNSGVVGAVTDNAPISIRTTEYDIDRRGALGAVNLDLGAHAVEAGFWYEDNDFNQARRNYGLNRASPQRDSLHFLSNPFATQWAYSFNTKTTQLYVQDTWTLNDAFKVNAGFKSLQVKSTGTTTFGSPVINGSIESKDNFLPQVGFTWRPTEAGEVFGSFTENMRAFGAAHTGLSPFATTQAGFAAIKDTLKPETSKTFELGYRFHNDVFQGVAAVYYVKFDNRIIGTAAGAGIVGNPTILSNVGSVTAKGFEAAGAWTFAEDWSLFGSYAFDESKYDDNTVTPSGTVLTAGKQTVDTPKNLLKVELAFDNGPFYVKAAAHYTDRRFFTYTNDQSVPAYTLVDLSAGYRVPGEGWTKGMEVQLNLTNLFDKKYVSTIGSNGFGNSGDNQTLLAGAPRQVFLTLRKSF